MQNEIETKETPESTVNEKALAVVKESLKDVLTDISEISVADQMALEALVRLEEYRGMVIVPGDKASLEQVKRARITCKLVRCTLKDACVSKREDAIKTQAKWVGIEKLLVKHVSTIEDPLEEQEKAEEKRIADEKKAEAERKQKAVTDRLNSLVQTGLLATPERLALAQTATDEAWAESFGIWKAEHEAAEAERIQREAAEKAEAEAKEAAERAERERVEAESRAAKEAARAAKEAQEDAERAERKRQQDEADAKAEELRKQNEAAALRSRIHSERLRDIVKLDPLAFDRTPEDGTLADLSDAEYAVIILAAKEAGEARQAAARKVQEAQAERRALENSWIKRAADIGVVLTGRDVAEWTPTVAEERLKEIAEQVAATIAAKELRARVIARVDALASYGCKVAESFEDLTEEEQEKVLAQVRAEWEQAKENEKAVEAKDAELVQIWVGHLLYQLNNKPQIASARWSEIVNSIDSAVTDAVRVAVQLGDETP